MLFISRIHLNGKQATGMHSSSEPGISSMIRQSLEAGWKEHPGILLMIRRAKNAEIQYSVKVDGIQ
jgi:hypothetical protein